MTARPGPRQSRPRWAANYGPQRGTTYLIHFSRRYKHAAHYTGWTDKPILVRFAEHLAGQGAVLTRAAVRAGIGLTLARTWENTTKDREDSLKHQGGARRFCPECGVKPAAPRLASDRPPAPAAKPPKPQPVPEYDFGDWPDLTADATAAQAAELIATLRRGAAAAYQAAAREWPAPEDYFRAFDTALEADGAAQRAALEAIAFHGREPDEHPEEWITRIRQEEQMFGRERRAAARERAAQEASQQAEADALFAEADRMQAGNFRQEITRERAARIRERLGQDLVRDARAPDAALEHWAICAGDVAAVAGEAAPQRGHEPQLQGAERDAEIGRLAARFGEPELWEYGPDVAAWRAEAGAEGGLQGGLYPEPEGPGEWPAAWDGLMARNNAAQAARQRENAAAAAQRIALGEQREHPGAEALATAVAAGRQLREARSAHVVADATVYAGAARLQEAALEPDGLPRLFGEADAAPRAPEAWRLPDGTPHADPVLAARGWQAQGRVYRRVPQAQAEAG